jgi:hypothetical protein
VGMKKKEMVFVNLVFDLKENKFKYNYDLPSDIEQLKQIREGIKILGLEIEQKTGFNIFE